VIASLQTSQRTCRESAGQAVGTEPAFKFWILQPYMSKVWQLWFTRKFFYQTLLFTSVTEPRVARYLLRKKAKPRLKKSKTRWKKAKLLNKH